MIDPQSQLELFSRAVDLLGGQRPTARALNVSERTIRMLLAGERTLHAGFLEDTAKALVDHADACRALERQLSPAFAANLTADQRENRLHGNSRRRRETHEAAPEYHGGDREPLDFTTLKARRPSDGED